MDRIDNNVVYVAQQCRLKLEQHHRYKNIGTAGMCEMACDMLVQALRDIRITASKHHGWCLYDRADGVAGEPCAPHFYVLVNRGKKRVYLDITATQFEPFLNYRVSPVMYCYDKPYWLRSRKPSIKEMERHAGY